MIDFGLAKATRKKLTNRAHFTAIGQIIGTPAYMSPEQAASSALEVDTRTDVYSLGVVLDELLTGLTPLNASRFENASLSDVQRILREEHPPTPSMRITISNRDSTVVVNNRVSSPQNLIRRLRGDMDIIVMKALEKDRAQRYENPGHLLRTFVAFSKTNPSRLVGHRRHIA